MTFGSAGANPNARTQCEETALHIVGEQSNTDYGLTKATVLALLDSQADPNAVDAQGQTPLFSYAILNSPSAVKLLCSRGADPRHRNLKGRTPLHTLYEVCLNSNTAVVLVKRFKADVDAQDSYGTTPLMLAAHTRSLVLVRSLLDDLNANPLLCNRKGHDALWFAKNGTDAPIQVCVCVRSSHAQGLMRHQQVRAVIRAIEARCIEWVAELQPV